MVGLSAALKFTEELSRRMRGYAGEWLGVPMATDIAVAVGLLALLGPSTPQALKLCLLTLAVLSPRTSFVVIPILRPEAIRSWPSPYRPDPR